MIGTILTVWLIASVVSALWPFLLIILGYDRPGMFVAIAPALLVLVIVLFIPAVVSFIMTPRHALNRPRQLFA